MTGLQDVPATPHPPPLRLSSPSAPFPQEYTTFTLNSGHELCSLVLNTQRTTQPDASPSPNSYLPTLWALLESSSRSFSLGCMPVPCACLAQCLAHNRCLFTQQTFYQQNLCSSHRPRLSPTMFYTFIPSCTPY